MNLEAFKNRAEELVARHVDQLGYVSNYPHTGQNVVTFELEAKTGRCAWSLDDVDAQGTMWPTNDAEEACRTLAGEFNLKYLGFEPCEKGWGSFRFGVI